MVSARTEEASERYRDIDLWPAAQAMAAMVAAQRQAIDAVGEAVPALAAAAEAVADRLRGGGRMIYAGAGSSGLLAQVDALELPGTYNIAAERVPVLLAGGREALFAIPSDAEDDGDAAARDVEAIGVGGQDAFVAVSASGRTPYAVAALRQARALGALTVGIACNPDTPLVDEADHGIVLATPPEVIAGSTRMNAGTAQKCALNMLSTLVCMRLGHAYGGMMVNLVADNDKLRRRAVGIVMRAAGAAEARAAEALRLAGGEIKVAVLLCAGAADAGEARTLIEIRQGDLRAALADLAARRRKAG